MQDSIVRPASEMAPCACSWSAPALRCEGPIQIELLDPLEADNSSDLTITLTQRQIGRLIFIAAETGARFARERSEHDPAAWLAAPRLLFDGRNALSACVDRTMFMRAIVLHGATTAYDMVPQDMVELLALPDQQDGETQAVEGADQRGDIPLFSWGPMLFTATFADEGVSGTLHVFFATIARSERDVRDQLQTRLGSRVSCLSEVKVGFDPSQPVASSLLSEAMTFLLLQIGRDPTSALAAGFNIMIEHRFEE